MLGGGAGGRVALEGKGPQRWPGKRLDRRLEEVAKPVAGGYCRLQMPLKLALRVRETVAGHRLGALEAGGWGCLPPFQCIPGGRGSSDVHLSGVPKGASVETRVCDNRLNKPTCRPSGRPAVPHAAMGVKPHTRPPPADLQQRTGRL